MYLKLQPYKMRSLAKKLNEELSPCNYGPYKILAKVGVFFCWSFHLILKFIRSSMWYSWKKVIHPTQKSQTLSEAVLDCRINDVVGKRFWLSCSNYKIWKQLEVSVITGHFPQFHLEDKVHFDGCVLIGYDLLLQRFMIEEIREMGIELIDVVTSS